MIARGTVLRLYGAGNGLLTIARGTLPMFLFDQNHCGALVDRLLVPSFLFAAAAPLSYAFVIERCGGLAAVHLSLGLAAVTLAAAILLKIRFGPSRAGAEGRA